MLSAAAASQAASDAERNDEEVGVDEEAAAEEAAVDFINSNLEDFFNDDVGEEDNDNHVLAGRGAGGGGDEPRVTNDDFDGERGDDGEEEEAWARVSKKRLKEMSPDELCAYFDSQLTAVRDCPNPGCNCVAILIDDEVRACVVKYLCWFNGKRGYDQQSIVFEWFKYSSFLSKKIAKKSKMNTFRLPYIDDGTCAIPQGVRTHALCTQGLLKVLGWGLRKLTPIRKATYVTSVMPTHARVGKPNYNSLLSDRKPRIHQSGIYSPSSRI
jgi:hypothetical protein